MWSLLLIGKVHEGWPGVIVSLPVLDDTGDESFGEADLGGTVRIDVSLGRSSGPIAGIVPSFLAWLLGFCYSPGMGRWVEPLLVVVMAELVGFAAAVELVWDDAAVREAEPIVNPEVQNSGWRMGCLLGDGLAGGEDAVVLAGACALARVFWR